jgi:hypothetical protein
MDIQELSKLSYDRVLAQKNLEERQIGRLTVAYSNGVWICNESLICLLQSYQNIEEVVLLDSNKIPRKVKPTEFLKIVQQRHQEVLNDWLIEYNSLSKIRTIRHVLE